MPRAGGKLFARFPDRRSRTQLGNAERETPPYSQPVLNPDTAFDRERMRAVAAALAGQGVFLGTSSWKYPGWLGQLYTQDRYLHRGRFAETRFERLCLAEYAEVFPTVCVDAAYYRFPDARFIGGLIEEVPPSFRFGLKVTDEITVRKFPRLPRFGTRAGSVNTNFLNADLFATAFLAPLVPHRAQIGVLIFEFSRFYPADFARGRDFVEALDGFLSRLPSGWPFGVEIRNPGFLKEPYFAALARHRVAHVFNSWEAMPTVGEQMAMPGAFTHPDLAAARFLLRPGRAYEDAVKSFSPYTEVRDPCPEARAAGADLIRRVAGRAPGTPRSLYLFVNNRLEGNALATLRAMVEELRESATPPQGSPPTVSGTTDHDSPLKA